ncbi:hypothetical protein EJ05DRAFT_472791 [Pseudovirgaria hyperparasitica]|uniref:Uncharacterized protein n=1 Tax=Pseudovirgaria hyperparasitica TaxID=470096 RepID=A0A6A6WGC7_9PEZI|nr:uncharacterized protein EJ05DRAFT_472791 [Pseudovirgaria hyperparasitica]KAF2761833.1 hypothetical protein EJ05DRAFT_472791 [Pseudovirgaria hyperparasitica]
MVLDEVASSPEGDFPSDDDLQSSDSTKPFAYKYKYDINEHRRFSGIIRTLYDGNDALLAHMSAQVKRRLTDEEVNELVRISTESEEYRKLGRRGGNIMGIVRFYQLRGACTMPGIDLRKKGFTLDKFFSLRGAQAGIAWQLLRFPSYFLVYSTIGAVIGDALRNGHTLSHFGASPILKRLIEEIRQGAQKNSRTEHTGTRRPITSTDHTIRENTNQQYGREDESLNTGVVTDPQRHQYERRLNERFGNSQSDKSSTWSRSGQRERPQHQSHDDASPTGGLGTFDFDSEAEKSSSNSAWERVRRGSSSHTSEPTVGKSGRGQGKESRGDGGTFTDATSGKSQAQLDFDAQLERERKGAGADAENRRWS